jgi:hypothetical protein
MGMITVCFQGAIMIDPTDFVSEPSKKVLSPAAQRALAEAQARRDQAQKDEEKTRELGGPKGLEPTRYGDWERKGIAYDF